ncbi:uncharacterized protein LOC130155924 [Falco biarmicus]|uniref:uncharacterized protein LOC114012839 n=1 Tax=Falco peregrinus TaxID=8954 RepID=UPI00247B1914|nr:uncharacterized protein LOC114012839 [Falco peregrinus]XP_056209831.1 uncharacterized protein LOC130155924 [Falco biarmicus]
MNVSSGMICECRVSLPEMRGGRRRTNWVGWISSVRHLVVVLLVQSKVGSGCIQPPSAQGSSVGFCRSLVRVLAPVRLPSGAACTEEAAELLLNHQPIQLLCETSEGFSWWMMVPGQSSLTSGSLLMLARLMESCLKLPSYPAEIPHVLCSKDCTSGSFAEMAPVPEIISGPKKTQKNLSKRLKRIQKWMWHALDVSPNTLAGGAPG